MTAPLSCADAFRPRYVRPSRAGRKHGARPASRRSPRIRPGGEPLLVLVVGKGARADHFGHRFLGQLIDWLQSKSDEYDTALLYSSADYYGRGYQDVQDVTRRVPDIRSTMRDLGWKPKVGMQEALASLFAYYRDEAEAAADLAI